MKKNMGMEDVEEIAWMIIYQKREDMGIEDVLETTRRMIRAISEERKYEDGRC